MIKSFQGIIIKVVIRAIAAVIAAIIFKLILICNPLTQILDKDYIHEYKTVDVIDQTLSIRHARHVCRA